MSARDLRGEPVPGRRRRAALSSLALLFVLVAAARPLPAQQPDEGAAAPELTGPELRAAIDGYRADLEALRTRLGIPGLSAAIGRGGEILWAGGFGRSRDPELRELGREAGRRRLRRMPGDPLARFHLAVSHARAGEAQAALPLLRELRERRPEIPTWMWSWSTYLYAEQIADARPGEAERLLERVLEEGQDEGGLFGQVRALLEELEGGG